MAANSSIVFGQHTAKEAERLLAEPNSINPCVNIYGPGPKEKMCKSCSHLTTKAYSRNYYKCDLRQNTNGPRTDQRLFWPSCAKFEEST